MSSDDKLESEKPERSAKMAAKIKLSSEENRNPLSAEERKSKKQEKQRKSNKGLTIPVSKFFTKSNNSATVSESDQEVGSEEHERVFCESTEDLSSSPNKSQNPSSTPNTSSKETPTNDFSTKRAQHVQGNPPVSQLNHHDVNGVNASSHISAHTTSPYMAITTTSVSMSTASNQTCSSATTTTINTLHQTVAGSQIMDPAKNNYFKEIQSPIYISQGPNSAPEASNQEPSTHPIFRSNIESNMRATSLQNFNQLPKLYTPSEVYGMLQNVNSSLNLLKADTTAIKSSLTNQSQEVNRLVNKQKEDREAIIQVGEELDIYKDKMKYLVEAFSKLEDRVARQDQKIQNMEKTNNQNNLIFHGFKEEKEENCTSKIKDFMTQKMKIKETIEFIAHRMGAFRKGSHRPILVKLANKSDKGKIFGNVKNLKGVNAEHGKRFSIRDHLPEPLAEEKKRFEQYRYLNNKQPTTAHRLELSFKKHSMYVGDKKFEKPIKVPTTKEILEMDHQDTADCNETRIATGPTKMEADSCYQIFLAQPSELAHVQMIYQHMKLRFPQASHISMAYRFPAEQLTQGHGYEDDGDFGNGRTLLNVLIDQDVYHTALFLVRDFGGTHLGPQRFGIITELAKEMLKWLENNCIEINYSFIPHCASCLPFGYKTVHQNPNWSASTEVSDGY